MLGALTGIFSQILHGDEQIRERAITFLSAKIRVLLVEDALPKDAEDELVALCKKVTHVIILYYKIGLYFFCRLLASLQLSSDAEVGVSTDCHLLQLP